MRVSNEDCGLSRAPLIDFRPTLSVLGPNDEVAGLSNVGDLGMAEIRGEPGLNLIPLMDGARKDIDDVVDIIVRRLSRRLGVKLMLIGEGTDNMFGDGNAMGEAAKLGAASTLGTLGPIWILAGLRGGGLSPQDLSLRSTNDLFIAELDGPLFWEDGGEDGIGNMVAAIFGAPPDSSDTDTGSSLENRVESILAVFEAPAVEGREDAAASRWNESVLALGCGFKTGKRSFDRLKKLNHGFLLAWLELSLSSLALPLKVWASALFRLSSLLATRGIGGRIGGSKLSVLCLYSWPAVA